MNIPTVKPAVVHDPPHHKSNFGRLTLFMIAMRTGWIFKTESIIMPAVLDVIGGAGWLRGCLPMLNRFGQSIPPMLMSDTIRSTPLKKYGLMLMTLLMGGCFIGLSGLWAWTGGTSSGWLAYAFLAIYAIFFAATGVNMLLLNTLKGKLIRVRRRGLLDLCSNVIGATVAVTCAWFLLTRWLSGTGTAEGQTPPNFTMIFLFTGVMFVTASCVAASLRETPQTGASPRRSRKQIFQSAVEIFRTDGNFRTLAFVGMMFGMSLTLFPHYQSLGRSRLELTLTALIPWVIAQNIGTAVFSIPSGWAADRFGNRRVLNVLMSALSAAPILALLVSRAQNVHENWYTVVFLLMGLTPIVIRTLNNYTLEIAGHDDHPRYLSTLGLCVAAPPLLLSVFVGLLVDWFSFELVFCIGASCIVLGWLTTFRLVEPRDARLDAA